MSVTISHDDALRIASRAGAMVRELYGSPQLVVGIERGGTAVSAVFARNAAADASLLVNQQRPTSVGWRGRARVLIQMTTPIALRKIYRAILFKTIIHASRRIQHEVASLDSDIMASLRQAIGDNPKPLIVVVDDAIDSGTTAARVLAGIAEIAPDSQLVVFSLTSTVGLRVAPIQINAFADIVEYNEGDLGDIAERHRAGAEWTCSANPASNGGNDTRISKSLYLDLDGTLVRDSFRCARNELFKYFLRAGMLRQATTLALATCLKKLRLINHDSLKLLIDDHILALTPEQNETYQSLLSKRLDRESRWTLSAVAKAPSVRSRIVTAALASYSPAIEAALGIPVITASGRGPDGNWKEVDTERKVEAIVEDRELLGSDAGPSLFVGDTIVDALASSEGVPVTIVPMWDETGLLTILAADSWWRPSPKARR